MKKLTLVALAVSGATLLSGCNPSKEVDHVADKVAGHIGDRLGKDIDHLAEKAQLESLRHSDVLQLSEIKRRFRLPSRATAVSTCYVASTDQELDQIHATTSLNDVKLFSGNKPTTRHGGECSDFGLNTSLKVVSLSFDKDNGYALDSVTRVWPGFAVAQSYDDILSLDKRGEMVFRTRNPDVQGYDYQVTIMRHDENSQVIDVKSGFVKHNADEKKWAISPKLLTSYKDTQALLSSQILPDSVLTKADANKRWDDNLLNYK